ncbi:hypothetical protein WJX74_001929 [Apatococcus lobatus]|uniref:Uncharacterized protein n=1 Tax=Apatococcus lobatus TaxID=904363 RepID=A0AAW1QH90_9CHLO
MPCTIGEQDDWEAFDHKLTLRETDDAAPAQRDGVTALRSPATFEHLRSARGASPALDSDGAFGVSASAELAFEGLHILEMPHLPEDVTTAQLEAFAASFGGSPQGPVVRWVNDSTALVIFPDPRAARQALAEPPASAFTLRPFSQASSASKAVSPLELQPPRPRPKTSSTVARRMLAGALRQPSLQDKAGEQTLATDRAASKARRQERRHQLDAAWEDD